MPIVNQDGENVTNKFHPNAVEALMWTRVKDCPNKGQGDCFFFHTCIEYTVDEGGHFVANP